MRNKKNDVKLYNAAFPLWLLLMFPLAWLIVIPVNFIVDSLVLIISMVALKMTNRKQWYKSCIFKIYAFGMLADIIGSVYMLLMTFFEVGGGFRGDELSLTVPALLISAVLIFVFDYLISFRKMEKSLRLKLSIIFATVTAPYTFLVPYSWLYGPGW